MSVTEQLQQIDQSLIQLLSQRLSLLATTDPPDMSEQLASSQPLLAEAGVPVSLWQKMITGCMAAVARPIPTACQEQPRTVTVVGGRGMMGRFLCDRLTTAGHHVRILEHDGWAEAAQLLTDVDLVLISVPLHHTETVIGKLAPFLTETTAIADIASIKTPIVQAMLAQHQGPVLGLHPMFGPGVQSFLSQKVVVCPGRQPEAFTWLLELIEADGGKLITCTPQEHDQMMVAVQAIRHFSTFSLGVFLAQEGIDISRSLEFASPIYRMEINMISRLFAQDASLYMDIMLASPDRCQAIARLVQTCDRLANLLAVSDRDALIAEFEAARASFREEAVRALQESNHMIENLSNFLATGGQRGA